MESFDKGIESSLYLFDDAYNAYRISIVFIPIAILFSIVFFVMVNQHYREEKLIKRLTPFYVIVGFSLIITISCYRQYQECDQIYRHHGVAQGTTLRRVHESKSYYIEYSYQVHGMTYTKSYSETNNSVNTPEIKIPNGHYRVIYNRLNPSSAVIDFKANLDEDDN